MEVIPLDDRVRSTTVLNTAAPSDFTTVYNDDNYDDAPDAFNDADGLAAEDLAADAAAEEGMWTRRNKLLLSLIAGSALLCAIATGSGVAAHRARVANLNKCPVGLVPVGATSPSPPARASAKSSKSPTSPTAKSSKSTSGPAPPATTQRALTGATVPATVVEEEEVTIGGAYYPEVPKTVEDKRKNRMLAEHLGQTDASSTLSWRLKNLGEIMSKLNFGKDSDEEQRLNDERRLATLAPTSGPTKSSKSPSAKASKSPTAKSSKSSSGLVGGIVDGLKPSDNCKCVNSGLTRSSSNGGGGGGGKSSKSPSTKSSKSPSTKSSKSPSTKSSKSPSTKSSKSPSTKSSKSPTAGLVGGSPLAPTTCTTPVAPLGPSNPMAPGSKSSKSPTSKSGKSTRSPPDAGTKAPLGETPIAPVTPPGNVVKPPAPPAVTKPPIAAVIPPPATAETKSPTPCTVDCPGVPVVDPTPTPPTPGGGGGENPSVPKPPPSPTPGTGELTPPVPTPPTPGTPDGGPTPSTPNCDNDDTWSSEDGKTCDDVANGDANVLCVTASSVGGTSASEACPAVCNTECLTNCDNDAAWESTDGKTCDDVAEDPIGLCLNADNSPSEAVAACPASCNKECFVYCDNDPLWIGVQDDETCDDVAEKPEELCDRLNSEQVAASEACPAACKKECFPPTVDIPVTFPTPKLDSYGPTPETTVGVTVTVGEEDKTPPTFSPSRVVGVNTPMPTNLGTSVGSSGGTITVSTETTGPPTLAIRND